ncbi:MAG: hypothetical protein KF812_00185 [Fimbriimonadaceae bacterium]|nr:hypothetical protein [Fimbriimonadaceae bacterium]
MPSRESGHQVFVRVSGDQPYARLGRATVAGLGGFPGNVHVDFEFIQRLTLPQWEFLHGSEGWLITVNHRELNLPFGAKNEFLQNIASLFKRKKVHVAIGKLDGDSMQVFLSGDRGWVMFLRHEADTGLYIETDSSPTDRTLSFECTCGIDLEIPLDKTVARHQAVELIQEYFRTGALPQTARWTEEVP